jgi:polygalacturonase
MPTENVYIRNCTVYASHGGFVIGSEMSGGARNIYVSQCTFIGSDIGLRFKTARGRGGVVENIFIRDIYMKDIPGEAILFDMYYMARDPIALAGEKRELPAVEFKPVNETTPVFRNFRISNVYCHGAQTGIFMRGLPEMHVQDVVVENAVIQARKGMDIQETSGVTFRNVTLLTSGRDPVVDIIQSDRLLFDKLMVAEGTEALFRVSGDRSSQIKVVNTNMKQAAVPALFELGAAPAALFIQN